MGREVADHEDWDRDVSNRWRMLRVHLNDGVIAAAGIVQGLTSAGATGGEAMIAALATTVVGGLIVIGTEYGEAAAELDSQLAIVAAERRRLELSPDEEFDELVQIYRTKGLTGDLARQVARQLSDVDALGAQLDAEYGIGPGGPTIRPWEIGLECGLAFMVGTLLPMLIVALVPGSVILREIAVFVVVGIALALSAHFGAKSDRTNALSAVLRTVSLGFATMGITLVAGSFLSF